MFNALLKKGKSNKGFTLIELIVVIAILAILALLLVPRFLGFTDSAKVRADLSSAITIRTAVTALVADGTIKGNGSFQMPDNHATFTNMSTTITAPVDAATLTTEVQKLTGTDYTTQAASTSGFLVTIPVSGDITVATYP